jgi:anti-sigma regulatory factor (Ser/Thr protein kinase)
MHLRETLKEWSLPELIDDGELVASELVTNVVRMAHDPVTGRPLYINDQLPVLQFGLFSDRAQLLISVWDQFPGHPAPKAAAADDETGRGLMIVGRISVSLDWYPTQNGKVVRAFLRTAEGSDD